MWSEGRMEAGGRGKEKAHPAGERVARCVAACAGRLPTVPETRQLRNSLGEEEEEGEEEGEARRQHEEEQEREGEDDEEVKSIARIVHRGACARVCAAFAPVWTPRRR